MPVKDPATTLAEVSAAARTHLPGATHPAAFGPWAEIRGFCRYADVRRLGSRKPGWGIRYGCILADPGRPVDGDGGRPGMSSTRREALMSGFPPIAVRQPRPYDLVDDPVRACGIGTGFE